MKYVYLILTVLFMNSAWSQEEATTIYLVRHAEKANSSADPDLSAQGKRQAEYLANFLRYRAADLEGVYSTPYKRTMQTAQPTATLKGIKITNYNANELDLKKILEEFSGNSVLIVGHSNTIPDYINKLIGDKKMQAIPENEYGGIYIITMKKGEISLEQTKVEAN